MKILKNIYSLIFVKLPILTIGIFTWIICYILYSRIVKSSEFDGYQIWLGMFSLFMPIMMAIFSPVLLKELNKTYKCINICIPIIIIVFGSYLLVDFRDRPLQYLTKDKVDVSVIKSSIDDNVYIEVNTSIYSYEKGDILVDSINKLNCYDTYKKDLFGNKSFCGVCFKSNLMKDYIYPEKIYTIQK